MPSSRVQPTFARDASEVSDRMLFTIVGERATRPDPSAKMVPIDQIRPDPQQPRKSFPKATLEELARSIQDVGFLQPVVVRRAEDGFILISGERRYRAAQQLGLREIPAVIRDFDEEQAVVAALIENLQRENIPPEEEAAAFDALMRQRGFGVRELARKIHKDPSYVSRRVRVYEDPELGEAVRSGKIAVSTAERLLSVKSPEMRARIRQRILQGDLDQQTARALVRREAAPAAEPPPPEVSPAQRAIAAIEALLRSSQRPTNEERRRLKALSDELLAWVFKYGPLPWA
ncbi:MAG: ParB/RepB/Spo0J family partition protein [Chloroflexota bacterium]|nr:ParB/RepB/Spo0J family partition protein [Dehalococcoidia bacterium]MDW8253117.1 ParB/RepB/Spo0J family partition protein [Chloroflexota bacterium]